MTTKNKTFSFVWCAVVCVSSLNENKQPENVGRKKDIN